MTFPIDQFTSLPPVANAQPRATSEGSPERSNNRADQATQDVRDNRTDMTRSARDLADERSNFQRHLDDQASSDQSRSAQRPEERSEAPAQTEDDRDERTAGSDEKNNHGYNVSEIAKETVTPESQTAGKTTDETAPPVTSDGTDAVQGDKTLKGEIVRDVASSKVTPGTVSVTGEADQGAPDAVAPADKTIGLPTSADAASNTDSSPVVPEQNKDATTSGQTTTAEKSAPDEESAAAVSVPTPAAPTEQTSPTEDAAADHTPAAPATGETVVAAATEPEATTPPPNASEGQFNQNAQKTENAERPGWGAQNAPRSETGMQAHTEKSGNANVASAKGTDTTDAVPEDASPKTPSSVVAGEPSTGETPTGETPTGENKEGAGEDGQETLLAEALLPAQENQNQAATPQDTLFGAPVTTAQTAPANGEPAATQRVAAPGVVTDTAPGAAKGTGKGSAGAQGASSGEKPGSAPQANAQANALAPGGTPAEPAAQANANAAANASPTGAAKALASGQGNMPLGSTPTAEEIGVALGGIDKRGTRSGAKTAFNAGTAAAQASSKAKAGATTAAVGPTQSSAAINQAAQSQAGQPSTAQSQPAQVAAMPDPSALASGADMTMSRGGATLEIDPATGALHMSGTGSAKMAGPNLSEVTMQFSRARMIQTPAKDIAVQIAKHLSDGVNRFNIRISPPEMGRIEVRLEITDGGKVTAHLVADKPETLDLLQKDRATLEKALAEAGLDTDADTLNFSMREGKEKDDEDFKNQGLEVADENADGQNSMAMATLGDMEVSAYGFDIVRMKRLDISI